MWHVALMRHCVGLGRRHPSSSSHPEDRIPFFPELGQHVMLNESH